MTDTRQNQPLTKDRIVGMQVVDADGFFIGKVRDISLCVGEMDQALVIETTGGEEDDAGQRTGRHPSIPSGERISRRPYSAPLEVGAGPM